MLGYLFPALTSARDRGRPLFQAVVGEARRPHWYREGGIEDSLDGRFAILTTLLALALARVEQGQRSTELSAALTERFVEAMDSEHRELGIGDPTLGKTVRKLTGVLAARLELWRAAAIDESWDSATRESLSKRMAPVESAISHCSRELQAYWQRLVSAADAELARGEIA